MTGLALTVLPTPLAIVRLAAGAPVPDWASTGELSSITRTADELSILCADAAVPPEATTAERGWRALKVAGPLDFTLTGILAALAAPLAGAGVSIFALSTYDTDYVLVRDADLTAACHALRQAGHAASAP